MRALIRDAILKVISAGGVTTLARRSEWRRRRLLILCFHGFSLADEHEWNPQLYITGRQLERRLRQLRDEGYSILPLEEALERLHAGTLPHGAVSLTVDDGQFDFLAVAYPILRRAGVASMVYVSTYYVLHRRPVFDVAASYLLWRGARARRMGAVLPGEHGPVRLAASSDWQGSARLLRQIAIDEGWSAGTKDACLERLAGQMEVDWEQVLTRRILSLMAPDDIAGLDPSIADVQLHTHRHRMPEDREAFLKEIEDNRLALAKCGRPRDRLRHFCYPSGVYTTRHLPWLREAGMRSATTTEAGLASARSDPLMLPRYIDTSLTPDIEFEAWAAGVRHWLRRPRWLL